MTRNQTNNPQEDLKKAIQSYKNGDFKEASDLFITVAKNFEKQAQKDRDSESEFSLYRSFGIRINATHESNDATKRHLVLLNMAANSYNYAGISCLRQVNFYEVKKDCLDSLKKSLEIKNALLKKIEKLKDVDTKKIESLEKVKKNIKLSIANTEKNLGIFHLHCSELFYREEHLEIGFKFLQESKKKFDAEHKTTVSAEIESVLVYFYLANYSLYQAQPTYNISKFNEILNGYKKSLVAAEILNFKGEIFRKNGDYQKSLSCHYYALHIQDLYDHTLEEVSETLYTIGKVLVEYGNYKEAEPYFKEASKHIKSIEKKLTKYSEPPISLQTARIYEQQAKILFHQGNFIESEEKYKEALTAKEAKTSYDNVTEEEIGFLENIPSLLGIAEIQIEKGDEKDARENLELSSKILKAHDDNSLALAQMKCLNGKLYLELGDLENAKESFDEALEIQEKLAPNSLAISKTYQLIAEVLDEQEQYAESSEKQEKAIEISKKCKLSKEFSSSDFKEQFNPSENQTDIELIRKENLEFKTRLFGYSVYERKRDDIRVDCDLVYDNVTAINTSPTFRNLGNEGSRPRNRSSFVGELINIFDRTPISNARTTQANQELMSLLDTFIYGESELYQDLQSPTPIHQNSQKPNRKYKDRDGEITREDNCQLPEFYTALNAIHKASKISKTSRENEAKKAIEECETAINIQKEQVGKSSPQIILLLKKQAKIIQQTQITSGQQDHHSFAESKIKAALELQNKINPKSNKAINLQLDLLSIQIDKLNKQDITDEQQFETERNKLLEEFDKLLENAKGSNKAKIFMKKAELLQGIDKINCLKQAEEIREEQGISKDSETSKKLNQEITNLETNLRLTELENRTGSLENRIKNLEELFNPQIQKILEKAVIEDSLNFEIEQFKNLSLNNNNLPKHNQTRRKAM